MMVHWDYSSIMQFKTGYQILPSNILQLQDLYLNLEMPLNVEQLIRQKEVVTASLTAALTKMKYLNKYLTNLYSGMQPILNLMNANGIHLQHFGFLLDTTDATEEKLKSIQTAKSTSCISSLDINCTYRVNTMALIGPIRNLCQNLKYLTSLKIKSYSFNVVILLIDVVRNLTTLENLEFGALIIQDASNNDLFYNKVYDIHEGRLKSICLSEFVVSECDDSIKKLNLHFAFILKSCPNLNSIELMASGIGARSGSIYLGFRETIIYAIFEFTRQNVDIIHFTMNLENIGLMWVNTRSI